jgi:hypothetical protein
MLLCRIGSAFVNTAVSDHSGGSKRQCGGMLNTGICFPIVRLLVATVGREAPLWRRRLFHGAPARPAVGLTEQKTPLTSKPSEAGVTCNRSIR